MNPAYRAIESTNTKTRRLAYLSAIISLLRNDALTERALLEKMNKWGQDNYSFFKDYWVDTGEVTSTRKNSAGMRYIELAKKLGLITTIAGTFRTTRVGLILYYLLREQKTRQNPFFLRNAEKIFFTYILFQEDADVLLTITRQMSHSSSGVSLSDLQKTFYNNFLERLESKTLVVNNDLQRRQLLERRNFITTQWKKPERYSEHIVPPRLNWMFDLEFLDVGQFIKHKCKLSQSGLKFFSQVPQHEDFIDVTEVWLDDILWKVCANSFLNSDNAIFWEYLDDISRTASIENTLSDTFSYFQNSQIPRVSFKQAVVYMAISLITKNHLVVSPKDIQDWFSIPRIIQNKKYEIRLSPRENESYLLKSLI